MKTALIVFGVLALSSLLLAQSSRDTWDSKFHQGALQQRKQAEYQQWLESWKDRECNATDVKKRWLMVLLQPVPDSMSANYYAVLRDNESLQAALNGTGYDYDAEDIADQINIIRLKEKGLTADAARLEQIRIERKRLHEQQQFQQRMIAQQQQMLQMQQQLQAQVQQLQLEVSAARAAADAAWSRQQR